MTPQQIDQLYKLGRLKQDGSITEEQFNEETQKVKDWKYELDPNHPHASKEEWPTFTWEVATYSETLNIINILLRIETQLLLGDKSKIWDDYTEIRKRGRWNTLDLIQANSIENTAKDKCISALATLKNNNIVTLDESSDLFTRLLYAFPSQSDSDTLSDREQKKIEESKECYDAIHLLRDKGFIGKEEYSALSNKLVGAYPK